MIKKIFQIKFKGVFKLNCVRLKKLTAALMIGAFTISVSSGISEAKRLHDPKISTKNIETRHGKNLNSSEVEKDLTSKKNFMTEAALLAEKIFMVNNIDSNFSSPENDFFIPQTTSVSDNSIIGTPMATQKQCVKYLMRNNPNPILNVSAEEIVAYYYEEGMREGIRPDVAFAQALKETGFFRYGGTVTPDQNNYCGLGTTSATIKGNYFEHPKIGVRAHIQHLLAYSSTRLPTTEIVDPRYNIVRKAYGAKTLNKWQDLNGRWAVPGRGYGQEILSMFRDILIQ